MNALLVNCNIKWARGEGAGSATRKKGYEGKGAGLCAAHPKGTDFSRLTRRQVARLQDFINAIPRPQSLGGMTAHEAFIAIT